MDNQELFKILTDDAQKVCDRVNMDEILGKTILITGASGLIGQNILASLALFLKDKSQKARVVAITQNSPDEYLWQILGSMDAEVLQGDLTNDIFLESLPKSDYIIHAAGYAQPGRFLKNPVKTLKLNTVVTFKLLDNLQPKGKFLFISSSEVYSGLKADVYKETDIGTTNHLHPRACYIESKRCGEAICNAYRSQGINAKSARVSLVYGPGNRAGDTRALYNFIDKALQTGKISLMDMGLAKRTYCYTADIVEILWKVLFLGTEAVYNAGGKSEISIADLAEKIGKRLNSPVLLPEKEAGLAGAPENVLVDTGKIEREFGKVDFVSLDDGMERSILWQKALLFKD